MRKRQISNMHGGYRGRGTTINWHTTYQPSMIQVENKPLPQVVPPTIVRPPLNDPLPTTPPQIIEKPANKLSDGAVAAIVGLSAASIATAGYLGSQYIGNILNIRRTNDVFPNYRNGIIDENARLLGGNPDDIDDDIEDIDQSAPVLINVDGNGPRERFFDVDL